MHNKIMQVLDWDRSQQMYILLMLCLRLVPITELLITILEGRKACELKNCNTHTYSYRLAILQTISNQKISTAKEVYNGVKKYFKRFNNCN